MSKFFAIIAFAVALPMSNSAHAYIKCDKIEKESKKKKCEKKMAKSVAKARKGTTAYKPSALGKEFAYLDAKNPFDTDDFYLGVKNIGIKEVDELTAQVNKVAATVKLAKYTKYLNSKDKAAAAKLGGKLLPHLVALKDEAPKIIEKAQEVGGKAADIVESPMDIPKVAGAVAKNIGTTTKAVGDIPGAIAAIGPIAKGGAAGAVGGALKKATGAVNQAKDAANAAKDAADAAKKATEK